MESRDIRLENGELMTVRINFLTLKLIIDNKIDALEKRMKKEKDKDKKQQLQMKIASKMIYIILRSNGKRVDEEEALTLVPADPEEIYALFEEFKNRLEDFKKKETSKM
jgi:hypothetical protein